ncbi:MAG: DNA recombination protein RmuC [Gammaproteobacteria bacterium]|nr:DNA recombination protein RmuC [Gammaproteobacteria bacterium]NNC68521.1 DNA recombination protein RmuC [Gammaproteobacteria bacterium]
MRSRARREHEKLESISQQLSMQLHLEKERYLEKIETIEESRKQLENSFSALSQQALKLNNENFLTLAKEKLSQFQIKAEANLDKKEKSIELLLQPIQSALKNTKEQIQSIEKERKESFGSLSQHLKIINESQADLRFETQNLVQALRRPEVRGQWGELTLKRIAELAGMVDHCDFYEQQQSENSASRMRPDMIVRMPDQRELIIDAKTPLDAYLNASQASDTEIRDQSLARHARNVRERMRELASKAYWSQFKNSPDFVVLFIPGEQFLSAALEQDPQLLEDALKNKVILATPTSIVALLRAVAFGWRQIAVAENAEKIRELGEDLYHRLATFAEHLQKLGKHLDTSVEQYNKAMGSLDRQVLSGARKFTELGIEKKKPIPELKIVETTTKSI